MAFRSALLISATAAVLAAPATPASPSPTAPGHVCTEIGCESGVFFDAGAYLSAHAAVQRVRVCALDHCRSIRHGDQALLGQPLVLPAAREQTIAISVTAYGRRGSVVLRRTLSARLRKAQPNGPQCEPICFQASVRLSRSGALSRRSG